jgi:hypothetical protein
MKVNINNRQYKKIIDEFIKKSIYLLEADRRVEDDFTTKFRDELTKKINDKLNANPSLRKSADELGINVNYNPKEKMKIINQNFNANGTLSPQINDDIKKVVEILKSHTNKRGTIDFANIRNKANKGIYGMDYAKILKVKDFIDANNLRYLYDNSIDPTDLNKFGLQQGSRDVSTFDINSINDKQFNSWYNSREESVPNALALLQMKYQILDKYLQGVYGVKFNVPNFPLGNDKVVDALMINFTSAYRCPAWGECLVKHACYARASEMRHYDKQKTANDKKNLMWLACENDPEMSKMVYNLLKAYIIDWKKVGIELKKTPKLLSFLKGNGKLNKLSEMFLRDIPTPIIEIIKQFKRVSYIRLNENGDFINQKLLEQFDNFAEDFKLIDVKTAAYSCRNLNFKGIKNIIINASRTNMEGPTIERYFYAIPIKMYEAFEDTYTSRSMSNSFDSIGKIPLPLYSIDASGNKVPNGSYYYKCPCSREDFTLIKGNNIKENSSVNCYQCHLCYEENGKEIKQKLQNGGKLYVFVKAHGRFANLLDEKREKEIIETVGVPQNYQLGIRDDGKSYSNQEPNVMESKSLINESSMQNEAFNEITKNAIYSMTQHFKEIGINENKSNFFSKAFEKINENNKG